MAKTIVIFPGGFHPFHKGHLSVYQNLVDKFPQANVYIASSPSTKERPFPFAKKKVLATAAGVPPSAFVEVKSPYKSEEITANYNPDVDHLIFALSQKDAERISFKPKKDGSPSYFQKWKPGVKLEPFSKHGYIYIAPVKPFEILGKEITSASAIRDMYTKADNAEKLKMIKELYPKGDPKKIKAIFDGVLQEGDIPWFFEDNMPARYKAGLSKSTAQKRKVFWKKLGKYPFTKSEYNKAQDAPGDTKETHPSKYTTAYKKKFGEEAITESAGSDKALKNKAEKSGIPYGILKQVYNRGLAAWVTGHRPGASQAAWGMARVNSFILKGKTWKTADSDLAKKVRKEEEVVEHIVKTKKGYVLYSKSKPTRRLGGPYPSKAQAIKRERQVQYFKHMGESEMPKKTFKTLIEEIQEDAGGEGGMILSQLQKIHDQVCVLLEHVKEEDNFEGWVQNKIDLAEDYIQTVYDYLTYNPGAKEEGDIEEVGSTEDIGEEDQETLPLSAADVAAADERLSKIIKDKSNEKVVNKLLSALKPRHKQVIELRFGLNGKEPHTLEEIGKIFDLTSQRIRTIEAYALRNMRRAAAKLPELQKAGTNKKVFAYQTEEDHVTHLDPSKGQQILLEGHPIPDKVKETAKQGIELRKEYKRGGTPAAIQMAKDIVTKDELSMPKIKAMKAYFFRNKTQVQQGESGHRPSSNTIPSDEWIAWQLYGGNPGRDWVEGILNPKKQADSEINTDEEDQ